jgi:glycosyltransferase involved in cell wall biosynthesis
MKVLSVLESVSRADGGIFEAECALQRELVLSQGCSVNVVALKDEFTDLDADKWLPIKPRVAGLIGPRGFGFAPGLRRLMAGEADLAYCAALWKYPSWALLDWQKKTGKPLVLAPHGSLDAWALKNSRCKKRIAAWLFKDEQLRRATCFRALCESEADAIRAYGLKQRIEVVPNGVELPEGLTTENTESAEGKKRLLFLGRIHPKKGLIGLLRAWAEIQNPKSKIQNSSQWQLVIAGWDQGGHEGELKALCGELGLRVFSGLDAADLRLNSYKVKTPPPESEAADVVFWGPAFGEEKEALLRSAEAFVLPSLSEGLPMSVLEAWAYGLPVVMTPECNLPEGFACHAALQIRNGEMGNAKWKGLRTLIEMTDADRIEMGLRGRRLVEKKFTWPKVAAQMRGLYEELL